MVARERPLQRLEAPANGMRMPPQLDGQAREIRFRKLRQVARDLPRRPVRRPAANRFGHRHGAAGFAQYPQGMDPVGQVQERAQVEERARGLRVQ